MDLIFKIRDSGLAVVVIEHDMRFIFNLCDRVLCLVRGAAARRGHARRGAVRPPGHRGLHRRRRRGRGERVTAMLEVQRPRGVLREDQGGQGHHLHRRRGRGRHPDRHQRCRQDDHPAHHLGAAAPGRRVDQLPGQGPHHGRRPRHRRSSAWPTPPRAGGSSRGSPSRRTCAWAPSPARTRASAPTSTRRSTLFPILEERRAQPAGTFSGGEQQMLAMGRAMMSRPKLLMLDEPSMGLSPLMMKRIMTTVTTLQQQGTTILLVEQNAQAALKRADKGYVLEVGNIVLDRHRPGTARQRRRAQGLPRRGLSRLGRAPRAARADLSHSFSARSRNLHLRTGTVVLRR